MNKIGIAIKEISSAIKNHKTRDALRKWCSENIKQIYRRTPMKKCDFYFTQIKLWHGCSLGNLLYIFRTFFPKHLWRTASAKPK